MLNNNRGAALAMVLLILAVGMVLGGVVLFLGTHETQMTYATENLTRAYYVARSGADAMGEYIINNPNDASDLIDHSSNPVSFGGGEATITDMTAFTESSVRKIRIVAEGVVPGGYTRTATLVLKRFAQDSIFEYGLFSEEDIDGTKIGTVGTLDGSEFPIGSNGTITTDDSPAKPEGDYVVLEQQNIDYPEPLFPGESYVNDQGVTVDHPFQPTPADEKGDLTVGPPDVEMINDNGVYGKIDVKGSLTFHVPGNQEIYIVVNDFQIGSGAVVSVTGNGTVHIYIENGPGVDADFRTPIEVGSAEPSQLRLYLEADASMNLQANGTFYCYIYGPSADISHVSSFTTITGAVIAKSYDASGSPTIIFDPLEDSGDDPSVNGYQRDRWED